MFLAHFTQVSPTIPIEDVDKIIKVELPADDPVLCRKIKKFMTHSKNHLNTKGSRCNRSGRCIYGFPHPITDTTFIDTEGRWHFRCPNEDCCWIASHIPELIDELECHIFVDVVFTVFVFMYLYKYLYKGPDHTFFHIQQPDTNDIPHTDEIKDYVDGRYLSAHEAAWRILGYHISEKYPSVTSLAVHLPSQNIPKFGDDYDDPQTTSSLLHYFQRPVDPLFDSILYTEYFEKYCRHTLGTNETLDDDEYLEETILHHVSPKKVYKKKKGSGSIARIQSVSPTAGELFYLRCLLLHQPARSFDDLKTYGEITFHTFHEAAVHCGLFATEDEGYYALQEAVTTFSTLRQLHFLFSRIILEGYPAKPLWEKFHDNLILDWAVLMPSQNTADDHALREIAEYVHESGRKLTDFGLPEPSQQSPEVLTELEAFRGREQELQMTANEMLSTMDTDQSYIYHHLYNVITTSDKNQRKETTFFVDGKPGRGKTFVLDALSCKLRSEGRIVLIVGTSALAATLYERGRTAHNLFRIPVTDVILTSPLHFHHSDS